MAWITARELEGGETILNGSTLIGLGEVSDSSSFSGVRYAEMDTGHLYMDADSQVLVVSPEWVQASEVGLGDHLVVDNAVFPVSAVDEVGIHVRADNREAVFRVGDEDSFLVIRSVKTSEKDTF